MTGWTLVYHTYRSRQSRAGFPDWVLLRERIVYVELKREKAKPTAEQVVWLDGIARAGGEAYVWRPSDLDQIAEILGRRWHFAANGPPHLLHPDRGAWTPKSLWIAGSGRAGDAFLAGG